MCGRSSSAWRTSWSARSSPAFAHSSATQTASVVPTSRWSRRMSESNSSTSRAARTQPKMISTARVPRTVAKTNLSATRMVGCAEPCHSAVRGARRLLNAAVNRGILRAGSLGAVSLRANCIVRKHTAGCGATKTQQIRGRWRGTPFALRSERMCYSVLVGAETDAFRLQEVLSCDGLFDTDQAPAEAALERFPGTDNVVCVTLDGCSCALLETPVMGKVWSQHRR